MPADREKIKAGMVEALLMRLEELDEAISDKDSDKVYRCGRQYERVRDIARDFGVDTSEFDGRFNRTRENYFNQQGGVITP